MRDKPGLSQRCDTNSLYAPVCEGGDITCLSCLGAGILPVMSFICDGKVTEESRTSRVLVFLRFFVVVFLMEDVERHKPTQHNEMHWW